MFILRRLIAVLCLAILPALAARAESTKITFILTNDIYSMGDTLKVSFNPNQSNTTSSWLRR